jgi:D-serine deaminase-like pyridoxal phosphate-dependent protein
VQHVTGFAARKAQALAALEEHARTYEALKRAGLRMEIFSGGGTGTYNVYHQNPGFTDVQVGSYVFMDMQYLAIGSENGDPVYRDFEPSLTVVATVLNNRFPGRLTTDAGAKALTLNEPTAGVVGEPGMVYNAGSDEFGVISFTEARRSYQMATARADRPHRDPVVNPRPDNGIQRSGGSGWPVTARGWCRSTI